MNSLAKTAGVIKRLATFLVELTADLLIPKDEKVRKIESMSPREFSERALPATTSEREKMKALFSYKDPMVKLAVKELKYRGNRKIAAIFAALLREEIIGLSEEELTFKRLPAVLIPIPMHADKIAERGWNQCEIICEEMRKIDRDSLFEYRPEAIVKIKDTAGQTETKSRSQRLENLRGAFAVKNCGLIAGRTVIIMDDVFTTGATFREARKIVMSAGAKKIFCLSVAH